MAGADQQFSEENLSELPVSWNLVFAKLDGTVLTRLKLEPGSFKTKPGGESPDQLCHGEGVCLLLQL